MCDKSETSWTTAYEEFEAVKDKDLGGKNYIVTTEGTAFVSALGGFSLISLRGEPHFMMSLYRPNVKAPSLKRFVGHEPSLASVTTASQIFPYEQ